MEDFKISLFEKEHKLEFPKFKTLGTEECQQLLDRVAEKYKIGRIDIEMKLASMQTTLGPLIESEPFNLKAILASFQIAPEQAIFINWYGFERIDVFKIDDLNKYFYDIWYPSSTTLICWMKH